MALPDDRTDSRTGFRNRIEDLLNPIDDDNADTVSMLMMSEAEAETESDESWWDTSSMTCPESGPRSPPDAPAWPYRNVAPPARLARTIAAPAAGGQPRFGLLVRPDRPLPSGSAARSAALAAARVCSKCGTDNTPEWRYAATPLAAPPRLSRTPQERPARPGHAVQPLRPRVVPPREGHRRRERSAARVRAV